MDRMGRLDEFDLVVRRKNARVIAGVPALGLYATADSTAAALEALEVKKRAYEADLEEAGLTEIIEAGDNAPKPSAARPIAGQLRLFALKVGIVVGIITAGVVIGAGILVARVDATIDRTIYSVRTQLGPMANGKIGGSQFWLKIDSELQRAASADNNLAPEKQERILTNIRSIVARVRPFASEIAPLFSSLQGSDNPSAAQNCK